MATVTSLPVPQAERRGVSYWMDRVLKELDDVRKAPDADAVHDLRVAIRRCRSGGAVLQEVDPDPAWQQMRRMPRKLFRKLGELRDAQVMDAWVKLLAPDHDPVRLRMHTAFQEREAELREVAGRAAAKFDDKEWARLEGKLRKRARLVPAQSLAAQCLAVERFEEAKELHARAQRTDRPAPWHELRIGLKRLRYTVENLLPEQHALWSEKLKRLQDLLGEVHDLDALAAEIRKTAAKDGPDGTAGEATDGLNFWEEMIRRERSQRIDCYRQLTLGKTSLWHEWAHGLPQRNRLAMAAMARLRVTARATDTHPRRTAQTSRIAVAVFDALRRAHAAPAFGEAAMRRVLRAAARLQRVGGAVHSGRAYQKAARRFLRDLPLPPSWTLEEWELLGWTIRCHRGAEPAGDRGAFSRLRDEEQKNVRALAGVIRLARVLRKCGVESCAGMRAEKSAEAVMLHVPGLIDSADTAARLAAGKHFLETYLGRPLILKPAPVLEKPEKSAKVVALLSDFRENEMAMRATASD
jgi:CHAD domain-containing protein